MSLCLPLLNGLHSPQLPQGMLLWPSGYKDLPILQYCLDLIQKCLQVVSTDSDDEVS